MFKNFVVTFVATLIGLIAFEFVTSHVHEVEGMAMIFNCTYYNCFEIGDSVYVIK